MLMNISGETEEEFSTRLANNLEQLILKEGPETVIHSDTCKVVSTTGTLVLSLT